jgi:predicted AAA+ superfamily ATPase
VPNNYVPRLAEKDINRLSEQFPAVAIVGPRQVGKTSLAKNLAAQWPQPTIYLDLENPADLNKLSDPGLFLEPLQDKTVILDEVQRAPALFPILRGLIDRHRVPGRFILLGSASPDLIRDASESLAGRIAYFELTPMSYPEIAHLTDYRTHWLRGGFPGSLLVPDEASSSTWRDNFIQTYLERDLPMLGLSANPLLTRRLWTMLAHWNGNLLNYEKLANSLGVTAPTVRRYIDFFESAYLVRRIQPWHVNISKRLVKSPKVYIRDTGVLHALLAINTFEELQGNPVVGSSWEAYILQEIASMLPPRYEMCFYRTQDGTEADLVLVKAGVPDVLVEIKYSSTPRVTKSMYVAASDLKTRRNIIVAPVSESYPLRDGFEVLSHTALEQLFE